MASSEVFDESAASDTRWRWRKWLLFSILGLVVLLLGVKAYQFLIGNFSAKLEEAIAEADRQDPGWRLQELEARRRVIPDDRNSAGPALMVRTMMPRDWSTEKLDRLLEKLPPEAQLNDQQQRELIDLLEAVEGPISQALVLADMPEGRYAINWSPDYISTLLPHTQEVRGVANLLLTGALLEAQEGNGDVTLRYCQAALNAGRSIGDEPTMISLLVRVACREMTIRCIERTLAQTLPSEASLRSIQKLLEDEEAQPLLLIAARGERAGQHQLLQAIKDGNVNASQLAGLGGSSGFQGWAGNLAGGTLARRAHPWTLRWMSEFVEIAKLPLEEQEPRLRELEIQVKNDPPVLSRLLIPAVLKVSQAFQRSQATVRCAIMALAAERYRLAKGHWPDSLSALVPEFVGKVATDPYDGAPLRYRRLADGVVIYSVGPDKTDDGGTLDRTNPLRAGTDLGFRLWDVAQRRQPPRPPVPEEPPPPGPGILQPGPPNPAAK